MGLWCNEGKRPDPGRMNEAACRRNVFRKSEPAGSGFYRDRFPGFAMALGVFGQNLFVLDQDRADHS